MVPLKWRHFVPSKMQSGSERRMQKSSGVRRKNKKHWTWLPVALRKLQGVGYVDCFYFYENIKLFLFL